MLFSKQTKPCGSRWTGHRSNVALAGWNVNSHRSPLGLKYTAMKNEGVGEVTVTAANLSKDQGEPSRQQ